MWLVHRLKGPSSAEFSSSSVLQGSPSAVNNGLQKYFSPSVLSLIGLSAVLVIASVAYPLAARLWSWMANRLLKFFSR